MQKNDALFFVFFIVAVVLANVVDAAIGIRLDDGSIVFVPGDMGNTYNNITVSGGSNETLNNSAQINTTFLTCNGFQMNGSTGSSYIGSAGQQIWNIGASNRISYTTPGGYAGIVGQNPIGTNLWAVGGKSGQAYFGRSGEYGFKHYSGGYMELGVSSDTTSSAAQLLIRNSVGTTKKIFALLNSSGNDSFWVNDTGDTYINGVLTLSTITGGSGTLNVRGNKIIDKGASVTGYAWSATDGYGNVRLGVYGDGSGAYLDTPTVVGTIYLGTNNKLALSWYGGENPPMPAGSSSRMTGTTNNNMYIDATTIYINNVSNGTTRIKGNLTVTGSVIAEDFVYSSDAYSGDAISQIMRMQVNGTKANGWGEADHKSYGDAYMLTCDNITYYDAKGKEQSRIECYDTISLLKQVALLTRAVQQLEARVKALEARLDGG